MRGSTLIMAAALLSSGIVGSSAYAAVADDGPSQSEIVAAVMNSDDPLVTLDQLPRAEGHEFIQALKSDESILDSNPQAFAPVVDEQYLDDGDAANAYTPAAMTHKSKATVMRAAAANRFNDLAWKAVEGASCVVDIADVPSCAQAKADADKAAQAAADEYPTGSLHNDRGDAMRHCGWNQMMYFDIGEGVAMKIANNHEQDWNSNVPAEKKMDLYNNAQGRAFGRYSTSKSAAQAKCNGASHTAKKDYSTPLVIL